MRALLNIILSASWCIRVAADSVAVYPEVTARLQHGAAHKTHLQEEHTTQRTGLEWKARLRDEFVNETRRMDLERARLQTERDSLASRLQRERAAEKQHLEQEKERLHHELDREIQRAKLQKAQEQENATRRVNRESTVGKADQVHADKKNSTSAEPLLLLAQAHTTHGSGLEWKVRLRDEFVNETRRMDLERARLHTERETLASRLQRERAAEKQHLEQEKERLHHELDREIQRAKLHKAKVQENVARHADKEERRELRSAEHVTHEAPDEQATNHTSDVLFLAALPANHTAEESAWHAGQALRKMAPKSDEATRRELRQTDKENRKASRSADEEQRREARHADEKARREARMAEKATRTTALAETGDVGANPLLLAAEPGNEMLSEEHAAWCRKNRVDEQDCNAWLADQAARQTARRSDEATRRDLRHTDEHTRREARKADEELRRQERHAETASPVRRELREADAKARKAARDLHQAAAAAAPSARRGASMAANATQTKATHRWLASLESSQAPAMEALASMPWVLAFAGGLAIGAAVTTKLGQRPTPFGHGAEPLLSTEV